ncbi:MAG: DUF1080 domain-containing protein [Acidobacteria bacterium]|nr:DUF1080 domain-containing protein [Acidobacteriota bacterium]
MSSKLTLLLLAVTLAAPAAEDGFLPLFDGKTLDGWTGMRGAPLPSQSWTVENGMIRTQPDRTGGDLRTVVVYDDFDLRWEWKIAPKGNSGIKYNVQDEWINTSFRPDWSDEKKEQAHHFAIGFEYQISDDSLFEGKQDWKKSATGALYLLEWAEEKPLKPVGEWNESRIVVHGSHGEHWLNGKKLFEFEMGSRALMDKVKQTKFRVAPGYGIKGPGPIVLTHHGTPVWYRNLRIKPE